MAKIAIVTAPGIGDGLILQTAAHNLKAMGHHPTTYNGHLAGFGTWLNEYAFSKQIDDIDALLSYDAIILQHDNSAKAKAIQKQKPYTIYGSHIPSKHGMLKEKDFVCDPTKTMVENVCAAIERWFGPCGKENGMRPPKGLIFQKFPKRIAIHPGSGDLQKNWPWKNFERLAKMLKAKGLDPVFLSDHTGKPLMPTLEALASFLYESGALIGNDSGPGHIASCVGIPTLIIGKDQTHMDLWRPGWTAGAIVTPPSWVSYWKWTRERWKYLISTRRVFNSFKDNVLRIK